jgi:lambda family phage minor tail protein L
MSTAIAQDITQLEVSTPVELLEIDATSQGGLLYRFANGTNKLRGSIIWQGNTYTAAPLEASGFEAASNGPLPRPRLVVGDVLGLVGLLVRNYKRLEGCKVTRKRTLLKYLDAVNFPSGINATADTTAHYPNDVWFIDRVVARNKTRVEWEMVSALDLPGVMLPRRQIQARACTWVYRSAECGYTGGAVAKEDDTATGTLALDRCGHRLASCKLRFGAHAQLPFGGFPGAGITRQA